jgi:hypothetical protein
VKQVGTPLYQHAKMKPSQIVKLKIISKYLNYIQGVSEISTLILTGNRTHKKEQLFSLPLWRKTLRRGLKK